MVSLTVSNASDWFMNLKVDTREKLSTIAIYSEIDVINYYDVFDDFGDVLRILLNPTERKRILNFCKSS